MLDDEENEDNNEYFAEGEYGKDYKYANQSTSTSVPKTFFSVNPHDLCHITKLIIQQKQADMIQIDLNMKL